MLQVTPLSTATWPIAADGPDLQAIVWAQMKTITNQEALIAANSAEEEHAAELAQGPEAATHSDPLEAVTVSGHGTDADAGDYQQHPAFHETVSYSHRLVVSSEYHHPISSGSDTPPLQTCPLSMARSVCRSARHSPVKVWRPSPAAICCLLANRPAAKCN